MTGMSGIGWDLLGTLAVGAGMAALIYAVMHAARAAGRPLPRWVLPAGIGLSMIVFASWNEYSWAGRVKGQLPGRVAIVAEGETRSPLRPWTYLYAPTARLALIDREALRETQDGTRIAPITLVQRWKRSITIEQGVDCDDKLMRLPEGEWQPVASGDPVLRVACPEG